MVIGELLFDAYKGNSSLEVKQNHTSMVIPNVFDPYMLFLHLQVKQKKMMVPKGLFEVHNGISSLMFKQKKVHHNILCGSMPRDQTKSSLGGAPRVVQTKQRILSSFKNQTKHPSGGGPFV